MMKTRILCTVTFLAGLAMAHQAGATDITIVTYNPTNETQLVDFLNSTFTDVGAITLAPYTGETEPTTIPAGDLVIFSRTTSSGDYDGSAAQIDNWNGLPNDMLIMNPYLLRNSRWGWADTGSMNGFSSADESELTVEGLTDPLFAGLTLSGSTVNLFDDAIGDINSGLASSLLGDGVLLATAEGGTAYVTARWTAGDALADTTPAGFPVTVTTHGGDRIFVNGADIGTDATSLDVFTDDGRLLFTNALEEFGLTLIPEPSSLALILSAGCILALFHRRRT